MPKTVNYTHSFSPYNSSVIEKVYYDANNYELYVKLLNRDTIAGYAGVPFSTYRNFQNDTSAGQFWNIYVKPRYRGISSDVELRQAGAVAEPTPVWGAHGVANTNIKNPTPQNEFTVKVEVSGVLTITGAAASGEEALRKVNELLEEQFEGTLKVRELTQKFE